jgi:sec-independent protein translocase protein TatA
MPLAAGLGPLGVPELLIIAFIVVLVFGVGRLPEVGGALGKGIREFRKSTKDDADDPARSLDTAPAMSGPASSAMSASAQTASTQDSAGAAGDTRFCSECGAKNTRTAKFCAECGHSMSVMAS